MPQASSALAKYQTIDNDAQGTPSLSKKNMASLYGGKAVMPHHIQPINI